MQRDSGVLHISKVLGRVGKATGKYKYWSNLVLMEPSSAASNTNSVYLSWSTFRLKLLYDAHTPDVNDNGFMTGDLFFE